MARVVSFLREYKEIITIILAIGTVAAFTPRRAAPVTLESLDKRIDSVSMQINALLRMQCFKSDPQQLWLAGINCSNLKP